MDAYTLLDSSRHRHTDQRTNNALGQLGYHPYSRSGGSAGIAPPEFAVANRNSIGSRNSMSVGNRHYPGHRRRIFRRRTPVGPAAKVTFRTRITWVSPWLLSAANCPDILAGITISGAGIETGLETTLWDGRTLLSGVGNPGLVGVRIDSH